LAGGLVALRTTLAWLRTHVAGALGPGAEIGALDVQLRTLAVTGLRLPGGADGWPAPHALRAERVEIAPSVRTLFSDRVHVRSIDVEQPYVSMLRTRDGLLRVVPTLVERLQEAPDVEQAVAEAAVRAAEPEAMAEAAPRSVAVDEIRVRGGEVEVFDATVRTPPWRIRLTEVDASVGPIVGPPLSGRESLEIRSTIDGPGGDGAVSIDGWIDAASRDLALTVRMRSVDLRAFEPYMTRMGGVRVTGGSFDLDLRPTVKARRLTAPGRLVLRDLALAGGRASDRVLGVPRDLLLRAMAARNGHIELDFRLEGDVDDPRFSLNDSLATEMATGLVGVLGIDLPGLAEGIGEAGGSALEGAGKVGRSVGSALKGMLNR
jgi:hypothetical protein